MEKFTRYFKCDYENDTTIEYVNTGVYSMLNCSFTSEDPDYGTDTIHFAGKSGERIEKIAYDMLQEIKKFLDYRDGVTFSDPQKLTLKYDQFSNSTLIAVERALQHISKYYIPNKRYATVWDASEWVAERMLEDSSRTFSFCESDREEANGNPEEHEDYGGWHGIKRIDGFFDNRPEEFIVAVGYYGGGCVGFGYAYPEATDELSEVSRAVRKAICEATGLDADNMIYIEEDKK